MSSAGALCNTLLLCVTHSGEGLACNLAGRAAGEGGEGGGGGRRRLVFRATLARNNCHQFAGRRRHAFHVVHARDICLGVASASWRERERETPTKRLSGPGTQLNRRNNGRARPAERPNGINPTMRIPLEGYSARKNFAPARI